MSPLVHVVTNECVCEPPLAVHAHYTTLHHSLPHNLHSLTLGPVLPRMQICSISIYESMIMIMQMKYVRIFCVRIPANLSGDVLCLEN